MLGRQTFYETYAAYNSAEDMLQYVNTYYTDEKLFQEFEEERSIFLIAVGDDVATGFAKMRTAKKQPELAEKKQIEIERIYVLQQFHGLKIGYALMTSCEEKAKEMHYEVIWLGVWKKNLSAIRFYEKAGFEIFGEQIFRLGADEQTDWLMKKELK